MLCECPLFPSSLFSLLLRGVFCVVLCCVVVCCCMWLCCVCCVLGDGRGGVYASNTSPCVRLKRPPCVPAPRPHPAYTEAFCTYTRIFSVPHHTHHTTHHTYTNSFCIKRALRPPTTGPRPVHSGTQSELCVQRERESTRQVIMVTEKRREKWEREREKDEKRRRES